MVTGDRLRALWDGAAEAGERNRLFLWTPVFLGAGIGFYFALPAEPLVWAAPATCGLACGGALLLRRRTAAALVLAALALFAAGIAIADLRTERVRAPVLEAELGPTPLTGRVVWVGAGEGRQRYLLDNVRIPGLAAEVTPARVRITAYRAPEGGMSLPGTWLRALVKLRPPPGPAEPGAWDFARQAWFERIGAMGFSYGAPEATAPPPGEGAGGALAWLSAIRHHVSARILERAPEGTGPMAAALLTGDRSAIEAPALRAMRDSGLAHLLAISGLHIGLVAGLVFFALRLMLALWEPVALRQPIKKWAAGGALAAAAAYLLLSGMSVPTQRAFVMVGFVLLAVILDRASLSMRLIAWAALLVLLIAPESMLGPSFQMSFAAATALIATYEAARGPLARLAREGGLALRPLLYVAGVSLTSLVAGAATAPFAVYHFNRIADYGLLANLGAVPVTGFWVMPWGLIALLLIPFGAEHIALVPMGWGLDAILWIAREVAALPGAVTLVPAIPPVAIAVIAAGGLWLCIWRGPWRFLGIAVIGGGILVAATERRPDILVDGDARAMAVRGEDGALWLSTSRRARFTTDVWLRRDGQSTAETWPWDGEAAPGSALRCDSLGCIQRRDGRTVVLAVDPRALREDCASADLAITTVPAGRLCRGPAAVIDRFDLWRNGSHALWLTEDGVRVESAAASRGERPWNPRRRRQTE